MPDPSSVDVFVIGGGINGAGIARDAAGRGLSVVLCEKDDLAEGTSSRSGKLVHGGLRYLEYYDFRLVREALIEREVLLRNAPHIIWPMRFVLPHSPDDRPAWLVRLGLFLYDHLGGRKKLPGTRTLNLLRDPEGAAIKKQYKRGFEYSDCWVDDARLVILNAVDAAEHGATVLTRSACTSARRQGDNWHVTTRDGLTGKTRDFTARLVINAAGPWVADVLRSVTGSNSSRNVRLVKGSHIIVKKFWKGENAYLVQNHDKRVIFINPYENGYALIGTTDIAHEGDADNVEAEISEVQYLLDAVNRYFKEELTQSDVVTSFSGVRSLFDDGQGNPSAVTRDYVFDLDDTDDVPLLNIFGGKITTFRELSEHALQRIKKYFPDMGADWTEHAPLPGGDMQDADFELFCNTIKRRYPWMSRELREHYTRLYGSRISELVGDATSVEALGQHFGANLYEAEALYLIKHEWARTAEDILWRRTKHRLHLNSIQQQTFTQWLQTQAEVKAA